jgi:hypothetical protein
MVVVCFMSMKLCSEDTILEAMNAYARQELVIQLAKEHVSKVGGSGTVLATYS